MSAKNAPADARADDWKQFHDAVLFLELEEPIALVLAESIVQGYEREEEGLHVEAFSVFGDKDVVVLVSSESPGLLQETIMRFLGEPIPLKSGVTRPRSVHPYFLEMVTRPPPVEVGQDPVEAIIVVNLDKGAKDHNGSSPRELMEKRLLEAAPKGVKLFGRIVNSSYPFLVHVSCRSKGAFDSFVRDVLQGETPHRLVQSTRTFIVLPAAQGSRPPSVLPVLRALLAATAGGRPASVAEIVSKAKGKSPSAGRQTVDRTLAKMVTEGLAEEHWAGRRKSFTLTPAGLALLRSSKPQAPDTDPEGPRGGKAQGASSVSLDTFSSR